MHQIYCYSIKLPTTLVGPDRIWYGAVVKISPYKKYTKVSSRAKDDLKSVEVGTCKVGHCSDPKILQSKV